MRSQTKAPKASRALYASIHGTVRVYTRRHINGCPLVGQDFNHCSCPKWIYFKAREGKAVQKSAGTPSFTEACEEAQRILKGFDPEIARARASIAPAARITVEAAVDQFLQGVRSRNVSLSYLANLSSVLLRRRAHANRKSKPDKNTSLIDFLDRLSPHRAFPVHEITIELADDWAATWGGNDLSSRCWRSQARAFFRWAQDRGYLQRVPFGGRRKIKRGNRCGYFTDEQYAAILATLPFYRWSSGPAIPDNYAARLGAFCDLGRWGGLAICDIVKFRPAESMRPDSNVITYRRKKAETVAQISLPPDVAMRLRSIPPEAGSLPEQPFAFAGIGAEACAKRWLDRFQKLCEKAGIKEITTEVGRVRKPHPHMLRDTCAISAIEDGLSSDDIARMLGHTTTQMTERSYMLWTAKRDSACIENQRRRLLARVEVAPALDAGSAGDAGRDRLRGPLVH